MPAKLKLRLAAVAAFLVFVSTFVVTLSILAVAEREMKSVVGDQQVKMLAAAASFMDDRIAARLAQMEALAASLPRDAFADPARLRAYLESQSPLWKDDVLNLMVLDARGRQLVTLRSIVNGNALDASERDYFVQAVATRKGYLSQPFVSSLSGRHLVIASAPVIGDGGAVLGVLTGSLDLQESGFLRQISALKPGETGYLFLMTGDGTMIEHPDRERLLRPASAAPGLTRPTQQALRGFEGWAEATGADGRASIYAYQRLRSTGWILGARYPSGEAFAALDGMRRNAIFGASGLALAAGALAWLLVIRLLAPLQRLRNRIRAIRIEASGIGVLQDGRRDEIGELAHAFYELMAERETADALRAASEKRLRLITDNLPVLIAYLDGERRFRFGNATFERWFGVTPGRLMGMTIADLMGEDAARQAAAGLAQAHAGQAATCELRLLLRGRPSYLHGAFIADLRADGSVAGVYALMHDTTHVKEVEQQLTRLARVDTLTGLANRRSLDEALGHALALAERSHRPLALAYLDIDHFKRINDSLGHGVGDEVLKEFALRLQASVRAADTPARLAGDEFVVILEDIGDSAAAQAIAAKIVEAMRAPFATGGGALAVSASVGVALSRPGLTCAQLLAAADRALYAAKRKGRDGYAIDAVL